jgi:hypothetical protein
MRQDEEDDRPRSHKVSLKLGVQHKMNLGVRLKNTKIFNFCSPLFILFSYL